MDYGPWTTFSTPFFQVFLGDPQGNVGETLREETDPEQAISPIVAKNGILGPQGKGLFLRSYYAAVNAHTDTAAGAAE